MLPKEERVQGCRQNTCDYTGRSTDYPRTGNPVGNHYDNGRSAHNGRNKRHDPRGGFQSYWNSPHGKARFPTLTPMWFASTSAICWYWGSAPLWRHGLLGTLPLMVH